MRTRLALLLLLILAAGLSCRAQLPAFAPDVPDAAEVAAIELHAGSVGEANQARIVRDRDVIVEVLTLIREGTSDWRVRTVNYPTSAPQTTALFKGQRDETLYVLWLGSNWVAGDDSVQDSGEYRVATMKQQQLERLGVLLGRGGV